MVLTRLSHAGENCSLPGTLIFSPGDEALGVFRRPLAPQVHLLDLPIEVLQNILGFLSYANVCRVRLVCQKMNSVSMTTLTKAFYYARTITQQRFTVLKSQMPRRESLRRKHPLVSQCDILDTMNMRLTLLYMTFGKHMDRKNVCFFPGGILDEVYRLTDLLSANSRLSIRITDELFDLSTMAMEHFKEQLEPRLPDLRSFAGPLDEQLANSYPNGSPGPGSTCASSAMGSSSSDRCNDWDEDDEYEDRCAILSAKVLRLNKSFKKSNAHLSQLKRDIHGCRQRSEEQAKLLSEYATRLDEHDKKYDEATHKLSNMVQELSECKSELQYWRCHASRCEELHDPPAVPAPAVAAITGPQASGPVAPPAVVACSEEGRSDDDGDHAAVVIAGPSADKRCKRGKRKRCAATEDSGDELLVGGESAAASSSYCSSASAAGTGAGRSKTVQAGSGAALASPPHSQSTVRFGKIRAVKRGKMC